MLFFSREIRGIDKEVPSGFLRNLKFAKTGNVVSHVTFSSPYNRRIMRRDIIFGKKTMAQKLTRENSTHLARHLVMKGGRASLHCRVNAASGSRPLGKFLVFGQEGLLPNNMIRAGKWTHASAVRNMFLFSRWVHQKNDYMWFTAMSAPNMVMSGALKCALPKCVASHYRSTKTEKFPGTAIETTGSCTPEMYSKGSFIIPGVKNRESVVNAFCAMSDACGWGSEPSGFVCK